MGEWLESVDRTASERPGVDAAALGELHRSLAEELHADLDRLGSGHSGTVRVPKGRVLALQTCERKAVADSRPDGDRALTVPMLRGLALDRFIAHQLITGRVLDPVGDLRAILDAEGHDVAVTLLDSLDEDAAEELFAPLATAVATAWGDVGSRWLPRVQSPAKLVSTGSNGAVGVTAGAIDVELGGPVTSLPGVLVEVKSSASVAASHAAETYLYALLVALRDRAAPAMVARWYPGTPVAATPVTLGVLESAARSLADAYRRWVELLLGRTPDERPGRHCRWCPDVEVCSSAVAFDDAAAEHEPW